MCRISQPESLCSKLQGSVSLLLSPLLAEMHTTRFPSSHSLPSNLKSNYFLLAFWSQFFLLFSIQFYFEYFFTGDLNQIKWSLHFWFEVDEFIVILRLS